MNYQSLFDPINIGSLTIPNRFVVPAMESGMTKNNYFTQQSLSYFLARAKGGFGLIITDYMAIDEHGIGVPDEAGIWDDKFISSLQKLTSLIHHHSDSKIFAQLHHSGAMCVEKTTGVAPKGPSAIPASNYLEKVTPFNRQEIYALIEKYGDAALRAKRAGFDGIEFQACHGYLASQFLSKHFNKRIDEFGGSYTNRFRFIRLAIENIKKKCGNDFPIMIRLGAEEFLDSGNHIEDTLIYAQMAEECGINAINVSTGTGIGGNIVAPHYFQPGFNAENTKKIKQAVSIPVVCVGRINDPALALSILSQKYADMIALGRQSICDPEFPNKVKENREEEIFHCTGCMQRCYYSKGCDEQDTGVSCMQNPFSGKEDRWQFTPAKKSKKICIIGAGPAGLEAGWILAKRGHNVTIFEKRDLPGGNFRLAAVPPKKQDVATVLSTYSYLCKKYGAEIIYNYEFTDRDIAKNDFDLYICATGAVPVFPPIPGLQKSAHTITANQILDGEKIVANAKVLILGGGLVGCETAEFLYTYNNDITIVDMADELAKGHVKRSRKVLIDRLKKENVKTYLNTKILKFELNGILAEQNGKTIQLDGYDSIILALGYKSYMPFGITKENIYIIGDAKKTRDAKAAIFEAAKLALSI